MLWLRLIDLGKYRFLDGAKITSIRTSSDQIERLRKLQRILLIRGFKTDRGVIPSFEEIIDQALTLLKEELELTEKLSVKDRFYQTFEVEQHSRSV